MAISLFRGFGPTIKRLSIVRRRPIEIWRYIIMVEKGDLKIARSTKRGSNLKRGESYKREKQKRPSLIKRLGISTTY